MNKDSIPELFIAVLLSSLFFAPVILAAPSTVTAATAKTVSISAKLSSFTPSSAVDNNSTSCSNSKVRTSGGTLDVFLHPKPEPIVTHNQIIFQVFFLQKGQTDKIQQHVDYDFVITKADGKQVFQASSVAGSPNQPLHTADGVATIPYEFQTAGEFSANVTVYGILFNPVKPESALFRIKVMSGQGALNSTTAITANTSDNSIMKKLSAGQQQHYSFAKEWGNIGGYQFKDPTGVATDAAGNVYVADGSTVMKFISDGKFITTWGSPGNNGSQIAIDPSGKVYVTDFFKGTIQKFTSDGKFITTWGSSGVGDGQFNYTRGIAVDSLGNVYVADSGNHRIQKFDSNGNFITKWGSPGVGTGQLKFADGIALDQTGKNVYVTDSDNRSVKVFTLTTNRTK